MAWSELRLSDASVSLAKTAMDGSSSLSSPEPCDLIKAVAWNKNQLNLHFSSHIGAAGECNQRLPAQSEQLNGHSPSPDVRCTRVINGLMME